MSKKPINGIYPHNLCPKSCKSEDCKYLHREWAQKVCFDYILKVCRKAKCDFNHVRWETDFFKEEAKSCSIIKDTTPED